MAYNPSNPNGQATMANSAPVVIASDQSTLTITDGGTALTVDGDVLSDSVDSGAPVKIGCQARTSLPTAVQSGDRVNTIADLYGRQLVTHIEPTMQVWKSANYTTTQTGANIWTPASTKKIAVTYLAISSYGTTAGRVIIWFAPTGTTAYSAGTSQLVWAGSFAPSTSGYPGAIITLPYGIYGAAANDCLKITSSAAMSLDISVYGYEF